MPQNLLKISLTTLSHFAFCFISVDHKNEDSWRHRIDQSINDLHSFSAEFALLEPRLTHASKLVSDDLRQIELKESELSELHWREVSEVKKVRLNQNVNILVKKPCETQVCFFSQYITYSLHLIQANELIKQLEGAHDEHTETTKILSHDLSCISEELDQVKKKMDGKASSMTDASPLVEIRAAIQRLKKENKELDIHIGVLVSTCWWQPNQ